MAGTVFVDTWGWIALGHGQDPRHLEIKGFYQAVRRAARRVYTSDYVLDEVITLLYRRESSVASIESIASVASIASSARNATDATTPWTR